MTQKPENPPAFARTVGIDPDYQPQQDGMSLRDYFAAAALPLVIGNGRLFNTTAHVVAADCYTIADAMLKARAA